MTKSDVSTEKGIVVTVKNTVESVYVYSTWLVVGGMNKLDIFIFADRATEQKVKDVHLN